MIEQEAADRLGFRIDVREDGNAGSVVWSRSDLPNGGVRPATSVEISLWNMILALWPMSNESEEQGE